MKITRWLLPAALAIAVAPLAATPAAASTGFSFGYRAHLANLYGSRHGMRTGVAVEDNVTHVTYVAGDATHAFPSASVVKVLIATHLLLHGQMTGTNRTLAWRMITRSDNAATDALYPKVGRDALLPNLAAHYGIDDLGSPPTEAGAWGTTLLTARGMVQLYDRVRNDPVVWPWLGHAMRHYERFSSAGEPNDFGVGATTAGRKAVKNGWALGNDVNYPSHANINTSGVVGGVGRYSVAIFSEGAGSLYYQGGENIVSEQARLLLPPGGPYGGAASAAHPLVVLDPGHNGANSTHLAAIRRQVPAGYGRTKACNTTGTATNSGYPEHAFTFDVASRVRTMLLAHGVVVRLTRTNDAGVGPCVNTRAQIESGAHVAAAVAIHADGAAGSAHGFHLCVDSRRPVGASWATVRASRALNAGLHTTLAASSGLSVANYVGSDGYYPRDDLAGLNLSTSPTAFLELGNMRNAHDAALQKSAAGRQRIAAAITNGILDFVHL